MKLNILFIAVFMTALFVGCDDYEDSVEQSPAVSVDNPAVRFASDNATLLELDPNITREFTLTVMRDNEAAALVAPITVVTNTENSFIVPESVSFDAGVNTATFTITMADDAPTVTNLSLELTFDESLTNPYKVEFPNFSGIVILADWEFFATGTYSSSWSGESYTQTLQYSPKLEQYRFPSLMADGYNFIFTWDGADAIVAVPLTVETGVIHATYGMVSSTTGDTSYDATTKTMTLAREWTVDAGSFGEYNDTYTMD